MQNMNRGEIKNFIEKNEFDLISYNSAYKKKKIYKVTISENKFRKIIRKKFYRGKYDYYVEKDVNYKIEQFSNNKFDKTINWEIKKKDFRIYFFEKKKKKHLYIYLNTLEESLIILNNFITKKNINKKKTKEDFKNTFLKVFKSKRYGNLFYQKLLKKSEGSLNQRQSNILTSQVMNYSHLKKMTSLVPKFLEIFISFYVISKTNEKNENDKNYILDINIISDTDKKVKMKRMIFSEFESILNEELIKETKLNLYNNKEDFIIKNLFTYFIFDLKELNGLKKAKIRVQFLLKDKFSDEILQSNIFNLKKLLNYFQRYGIIVLDFFDDEKLIIQDLKFGENKFFRNNFSADTKYVNFNLDVFNNNIKFTQENPLLINRIKFHLISNKENDFFFYKINNMENNFALENLKIEKISYKKFVKKVFKVIKNYEIMIKLKKRTNNLNESTYFEINNEKLQYYTDTLLSFFSILKNNKQNLKISDEFKYLKDGIMIKSVLFDLCNSYYEKLKKKLFIYPYFILLYLKEYCPNLHIVLVKNFVSFFFYLVKISFDLLLELFGERHLLQLVYFLILNCKKEDNYEKIFDFFISALCLILKKEQRIIIAKLNQNNLDYSLDFLTQLLKKHFEFFFENDNLKEITNFNNNLLKQEKKTLFSKFTRNFNYKLNNILQTQTLSKNFITLSLSSYHPELFLTEKIFEKQKLYKSPLLNYTSQTMKSLDSIFPCFLIVKYNVLNSVIVKNKDIYLEVSLDGSNYEKIFQRGRIEININHLNNYVDGYYKKDLDEGNYKSQNILNLRVNIYKYDDLKKEVLKNFNVTLNFLDFYNKFSNNIVVEDEFLLKIDFLLAKVENEQFFPKNGLINFYQKSLKENSLLLELIPKNVNSKIADGSILNSSIREKGEISKIYNKIEKKNLFHIRFNELGLTNDQEKLNIFNLEINYIIDSSVDYINFETRLFNLLNFLYKKPSLISENHLIQAIKSIFLYNKIYLNESFIYLYFYKYYYFEYLESPLKAFIYIIDENNIKRGSRGEMETDDILEIMNSKGSKIKKFNISQRNSFCQNNLKSHKFIDISERLNDILRISSMTVGLGIDFVDQNGYLKIIMDILFKPEKFALSNFNILVVNNIFNEKNSFKIDFDNNFEVIEAEGKKSFNLLFESKELNFVDFRKILKFWDIIPSLIGKRN